MHFIMGEFSHTTLLLPFTPPRLTNTGWAQKSKAYFCNWLPIAGSTFLEVHLVKVYRDPILKTEFEHVHDMLGEILTDCTKMERANLPGKKMSVGVKSYMWVDGLSSPVDLSPIENVLQSDAEKLCCQKQSHMEGH